MRKILCIFLISVCMTVGAAACGTSRDITLEEAAEGAVTEVTDVADTATPEADMTTAAAANDAERAGEEQAADQAALQETTVCVYVCGEVVTPGVYSLPEGARIYEALTLAGGLTDAADIAIVNQAQEITDGMMIRIPAIGESQTQDPVQTAEGSASDTNAGSGLVNINTADAAQLCTLPGIGASKAAAILAYREEHGSFASKEDLLNVSGIGDATYRNLESQIAVQ